MLLVMASDRTISDEPLTPKQQEVILQRVKIACSKSFGSHMTESMELLVRPDRFAGEIAYHFRAFLLGEKTRELDEDVYFEYPADWWQHFKMQHFPEWLQARFPPRMARAKKTVHFEQIECFPKASLVLPKGEREVHFPVFSFSQY